MDLRRRDLLFGPADYPYTKYCPEWQSGLKMGVFYFRPVLGNRSYWGTFDPLFSDYGYSGLESEIADSAGRKTGLNIPFWLADLLIDQVYPPKRRSGTWCFTGIWDRLPPFFSDRLFISYWTEEKRDRCPYTLCGSPVGPFPENREIQKYPPRVRDFLSGLLIFLLC